MHSGKPSSDLLTKLANAPGGGPVLDALVADLPDDINQDVLAEAVKARYGIKVEQFDHRTNAKTGATRTAANPKSPDKALKGLYKVLGQVPLKDTKNVKNIERYTEESGGASYRNGAGLVKLYCGRPGDGNNQEFNKKGELVPEGEKVDKNCEPINPKVKVPYFNFATLHEVGHAVDDVKGVMKGGRNADAGWKAHSASDIANIAGDHFHYDKHLPREAVTASKKRGADGQAGAAERHQARGLGPGAAEGRGLGPLDPCRRGPVVERRRANARRSAAASITRPMPTGATGSATTTRRAPQGVTGYQFRAPGEWFAELYAAFFSKKLNPKHPAAAWLAKLKAEKT